MGCKYSWTQKASMDPHPFPIENFRVYWRWTGCVWSSSNRAASHQVWVQKHLTINPVENRSIIPCATSAMPWPVFYLLYSIFGLTETRRWVEACLWMETEWVNGVSLGEWACGCWQGTNRRIITVCLMVHQSILHCSLLMPLTLWPLCFINIDTDDSNLI